MTQISALNLSTPKIMKIKFTGTGFDVIQDNPVGTGYSYVEDKDLLVKTDDEAATDLTTLLIELFNKNQSLQKSPLYIVAESYGGKYAVTTGLSILKAIETGKLKLKLGGKQFFFYCHYFIQIIVFNRKLMFLSFTIYCVLLM